MLFTEELICAYLQVTINKPWKHIRPYIKGSLKMQNVSTSFVSTNFLTTFYMTKQCDMVFVPFVASSLFSPRNVFDNQLIWWESLWQNMPKQAKWHELGQKYAQCLIIYSLPIDLKGLKFLVRICTDLGLKDVQDYAQKLKKAEKARELKQQVIFS